MNITVAKHTYKVIRIEEQFLYPYRAFMTEDRSNTLFTLRSSKASKPQICQTIGDFSDENGRTLIGKSETGYLIDYFAPNETTRYATLTCDSNFQSTEIALFDSTLEELAINNALMMLYAFTSSYHDTLLAHSSVIVWGEKAYLFLGKSGTGKSTHTRLWLEHIQGSRLLNDDNPVIRFIDSLPMAFGSPWSGKTPCYINEAYPIGGIVRLRQSPENSIQKIKGAYALAAILPSFSTLPCSREIQENTINTATRIAESTSIYTLSCRPDAEAAQLCYRTLTSSME